MLKFVLLGLLVERPRHGYELKQEFEDLAGGTWAVNIGQIYTTMGRLERDGLVESEVVSQDARPDRRVFTLTNTGEKALRVWLEAPAEEPVRLKDELFLKVLVHHITGRDVAELLSAQRHLYLQSLAELTALQRDAGDQPTLLLLEGTILHVQADLQWLDRCEAVLGGRA